MNDPFAELDEHKHPLPASFGIFVGAVFWSRYLRCRGVVKTVEEALADLRDNPLATEVEEGLFFLRRPLMAPREDVNKWYAEHAHCPNCLKPAETGVNKTLLPSVPFCDNRTRAWCIFCGWRGLVMDLVAK